ncbi:hypothetical protein D0T84_01900 [Dysgonomonas sp. 521]|uniref:porin family protein n=1 Tax=Dysgonomonas sp. 521 TaxID=2302932 RepID=UPI0013D75EEB|nr:porin family protein [Dysgonomonas sp. 521]NDV93670.1 hypothetical protein [Dysgonomonas sp. 521]
MKNIKLTLTILIILFSTNNICAQYRKFIGETALSDNLFLQLQTGGSYIAGSRSLPFFEGISPHISISAGKHFSPILGVRLQVSGWQNKKRLPDSHYSAKYLHTGIDALFSLTNIFRYYVPSRKFNLFFIGGIGYVHSFSDKAHEQPHTNNIVPRIGFQADWKVSERISLNIETNGNLYPNGFNGRVNNYKNDYSANLLLGITYKITYNRSGIDFPHMYDPGDVIDTRNEEINRLRQELHAKETELKRLKEE